MKSLNKILPFLALIALVSSCSDDEGNIIAVPLVPETGVINTPTPTFTSGTADFSKYVSVGNSLTAGLSDGALFIKGQEVSFPNILASQFALAGGGSFSQPLMNDDIGGLLLQGNPIAPTRFIFDPVNQVPFNIPGTPTTEVTSVVAGPHNNMGVPLAKSFHLLANGYGNVAGVQSGQANPFFARMASNPNASVLEDAMAQSPTFFTLWVGSNDVLSYATSGGAGEDHNVTGNLDPSTYGGNDITNANTFAQVYGGILTTLTLGGAKGVIANLPNVTDAPFFTTVPYNPIPMDAATAAATNGAYAQYNGGLQQALAALAGTGLFSAEEAAKRTINFTAGQNAVVIVDEDLTDLGAINPAFAALPKLRQATADDLLVLTSQTIIGTLADPGNPASVNGVGVALADNWVLTPEEQTAISNATTAFNGTIEMMATQFDVGFFDANALLNIVTTDGLNIGGSATINADFVTGGAFSLDGLHPSPRGNAVIANAMIDVISAKYGASLPKVNPVEFTGLYVN
ncbi:MAG: G-D-S-L family lipolytic protein [Aurantibacter sp.]